ncbi:MAG: FAD-dependent oxidoreductase [Rhodobacterales bacterium]|nr:FAD-dependent oxidoreductase [Rhodobacterales bacterium]
MVPHVVVLGGGFGGLAAAKGLARADVRVTLIDRSNHHLFQPLLYQVATAALAPSDIAEPLRSILSKQKNVRVRLAEALRIDADQKQVQLQTILGDNTQETLSYDYLVVAMGVQQSWFGRDDWEAVAPGLKSIRDALDIRRRILAAFEQAEWCQDEAERRRLMTFVVVGGGPTGVELAGAIAEIALHTFRTDSRNIDTADSRVVLVEASDSVLGTYPADLRQKALEQLHELKVDVRLGTPASEVDEAGVIIDGERINAKTVLWAAGMKAPAITQTLGTELDRAGRIIVQADTSLPGHPNLFAIGDICHYAKGDSLLPGTAPVALDMGKHVAQCIIADLGQKKRPTFAYFDKGQMATIGRRRAIMQSGPIKLAGTLAWLAWLFIHLMVLVTYRNRLLVFMKWSWAWFSYERASRLIWQPDTD